MSRKGKQQSLFLEGTLCYLCQSARATTEDHVPPQCFFPSGDQKGYTLPACGPCNQAFAKDDEYVRDMFVMAAETDEARQLFNWPITRSFTRPYERLKPEGKL